MMAVMRVVVSCVTLCHWSLYMLIKTSCQILVVVRSAYPSEFTHHKVWALQCKKGAKKNKQKNCKWQISV